jgi:hypothetical protein
MIGCYFGAASLQDQEANIVTRCLVGGFFSLFTAFCLEPEALSRNLRRSRWEHSGHTSQ